MNARFSIKEIESEEIIEFSDLVLRVFNEFVAPDFTKEGCQVFRSWLEPGRIIERLKKGKFILVAKDKNTIVGGIEIRKGSHISLLFVDKGCHGRGIAKILIEEATKKCLEKSDIKEITVHASPFAVPIYLRLGFQQIEPEQEVDGMRFTSMKKGV